MHCCVSGCKNDSRYLPKPHGVTFHTFPLKESVRSSWLRVLGMVHWDPKNVVCSDHFCPQDFYFDKHGYKRLKIIALPTVLKGTSWNGHQVNERLKSIYRYQSLARDIQVRRLKANHCEYAVDTDAHTDEQAIEYIAEIKDEDTTNETVIENVPKDEMYVDDDQFGVMEVEVHTNVDLTEEIKLKEDVDCEFEDNNECVQNDAADLYGYDTDTYSGNFGNWSDSDSLLSLETRMMEQKAMIDRRDLISNSEMLYYYADVAADADSLNGSTYDNDEALGGSEFADEEDVCEEVPEGNPLCEICNIRFKNVTALTLHLRTSKIHAIHDSGQSRSAILSKMYKGGWNKSTTKKCPIAKLEPIECEQCGAEVEDARAYHFHFRREHKGLTRTKYPTMRRPSMCDECGRFFQNETKLRHHKAFHTGEKRHRCNKCNKIFSGRANLLNHQKIHNKLRPIYECDYCPKQYVSMFSKKRHMQHSHTFDAPQYDCEKCGKSYPSPSDRRSHFEHVHLKIPWPKRRSKVKVLKNVLVCPDYQ